MNRLAFSGQESAWEKVCVGGDATARFGTRKVSGEPPQGESKDGASRIAMLLTVGVRLGGREGHGVGANRFPFPLPGATIGEEKANVKRKSKRAVTPFRSTRLSAQASDDRQNFFGVLLWILITIFDSAKARKDRPTANNDKPSGVFRLPRRCISLLNRPDRSSSRIRWLPRDNLQLTLRTGGRAERSPAR